MAFTGQAKRDYQLQWINNRREEWLLANGPCVVCDSWEDLEVDHIDPDQKKLTPAKLWSLSPENPKRITELAKCQVLCQAHHLEKTKRDLAKKFDGTKSSSASLTPETLIEVRSLLAEGVRGSDIARKLGVSKFTISRVKCGKAYR